MNNPLRRALHILAVSDRRAHPALALAVEQLRARRPGDTVQLLLTTAGERVAGAPLDWGSINWASVDPAQAVLCAAHWGPRTREAHLEVLKRAPGLRWVHSLSTGVEHLPLAEFGAAGAVVTHHVGASDAALAEFALGGLLHFEKQLPRLLANSRAAKWERFEQRGLFGRTLAVVGFGNIGRRVGRAARLGFGMRVVAITRRPLADLELREDADGAVALDQGQGEGGESGLAEALRESGADHVLLALPHTGTTAGLVGAAELAAMRPGTCLINVGRGTTVDEDALAAVLADEERRLSFVGDVFAEEPLPAGSALWGRPNALISPHAADWVDEVKEASAAAFVENVEAWAAGGELQGVVDIKKGY